MYQKFSDPDAPFNTTASRRDIFLARLAETYLIRAEAYIKLGTKQTEAKNDINVVRTRAGAAIRKSKLMRCGHLKNARWKRLSIPF